MGVNWTHPLRRMGGVYADGEAARLLANVVRTAADLLTDFDWLARDVAAPGRAGAHSDFKS